MEEVKIEKKQYAYGFLVLSVVVAIFAGFFLIKPWLSDNKVQDAKIKNRKEALLNLEYKLLKLSELAKESEEIEQDAEKIKIAMPRDVDKARLIYQLDVLASNAEISLESIADDISLTEDEIESVETLAQKKLISLNIKGRYEGVRKFLSEVNKAIRIVKIEKIEIKPQENMQLDINFIASIYHMDPDEQEEVM